MSVLEVRTLGSSVGAVSPSRVLALSLPPAPPLHVREAKGGPEGDLTKNNGNTEAASLTPEDCFLRNKMTVPVSGTGQWRVCRPGDPGTCLGSGQCPGTQH